ncbi:ABC transporter substrate-binding protein [Streptomyces virginiae]|uniref:ABC transporter substrate-binding protein n=1 Tax=Streptomyces virginiae TaxID=1961 RepID=UPI00131D2067|nr:ABC transporter substrate-binding protein [Streptomyces virginiae]
MPKGEREGHAMRRLYIDPSNFSRRQVLKGAMAGCLGSLSATSMASCSSSGGESERRKDGKVTVALGWIKNVEFAGYWIADSNKYYEKQGLNVTFRAGGPNAPSPVQLVSSGTAEIGISPGMQDLLQAISRGNDFVILGAQYQTSPGGLLSLARRPVTGPGDLPNLRILGQQGVQSTLTSLYKINGIPVDYKFIPAGFDPGSLVRGAGDAYTCYVTSQPIILEQQYNLSLGSGYEVVTYADLGLPAYANLIFCKRSYLKSHFGTLQSFLRASVRGWKENVRDPGLAARLATTVYGVDYGLVLSEQVRENELQIPLTESPYTRSHGLMSIDIELMGGKMYSALEAGGVTNLPPPRNIVDKTVLNAAQKAPAAM